jgi:AraC family transcriptional regulator, positive regulator of tynA and feaB
MQDAADGRYGRFVHHSGDDPSARPFDAFARDWARQFGEHCPLPPIAAECRADFRISSRVTRLYDLAITDLSAGSELYTAGRLAPEEDNVEMSVVMRGSWATTNAGGDDARTVRGGSFSLRHMHHPEHFRARPGTTVRVISMPSAVLQPLVERQPLAGAVTVPEMRLLVAHADAIHESVAGLGAAGAEAAYQTLLELAKAVARRQFDDNEPQLAPALVAAAKRIIDRRLADRALTPAFVAGLLHVSPRTMQRAFAESGEPISTYIRRRRLAEVRTELTTASERPNIAEIAARWQFSDGSHLSRSFKKEYGQAPAAYAQAQRATGQTPDAPVTGTVTPLT